MTDAMFPQRISRLGQLRTEHVLEYYDHPVLFTCRNDLGYAFLAVAVDHTDTSEQYLYVPVSEDRLTSILTGLVSLHDAFAKAETERVFVVSIGRADEIDSVEELPAAEVPVNWLPAEGEYLDEPVETAFQFTPQRLADMAERQGRSLTALEFDSPVSLRTEIPLARAGEIMTEFQDLAQVLAFRERRPQSGETLGDVAREAELAFVQLAAASFVLIVAPFTPARLVPLPSAAMQGVAELLDATREDQLSEAVSGLPTRTVVHLRNFLDSVSDLDSGLRMVSAVPGQPLRETRVSLGAIRNGLHVLRARKELAPQRWLVVGHLMAINHIKRTFAIVETEPTGRRKHPRTISGRFDAELLPELDGMATGQSATYRFAIVVEQDVPEFPDAKPRSRYRMEKVSQADASDLRGGS